MKFGGWAVAGLTSVVRISRSVGVSAVDFNYRTPTALLTTNSVCSDWTAWMPERVKPAVIVQVVTKDYLMVQRNFVQLMEANSLFSRANLYILCLDEESTDAMARMGLKCFPVAGKIFRSVSFIWKLRVKVTLCLLEAGYDIILSDSDALWVSDPTKDFNLPEVRTSSIVASRGFFPKKLGGKWGSTMCMGFVFFRSTGAGMDLFQVTMNRIALDHGDDQLALNLAANELGIIWDTTSDMRYIASSNFGRGTIPNLAGEQFNVTLLPHRKYKRKCTEAPVDDETVVAHCRSKKNGQSKTLWMERAGLWRIHDT